MTQFSHELRGGVTSFMKVKSNDCMSLKLLCKLGPFSYYCIHTLPRRVTPFEMSHLPFPPIPCFSARQGQAAAVQNLGQNNVPNPMNCR
jgi:hypothetical protein